MAPTITSCPRKCLWSPLECDRCTPPALPPPADVEDPFGFDEDPPPVLVAVAVGGVTVAAAVVIVGTSAVAWAVGVVFDAIRGRP